jgi:Cd2+/Zn2+-exporting ATPase
MNIRAEYANLIKDNKEIKVSPEELKVDDVIVIKPGERVPIDGLIIEGKTSIDTSALTGESIPKDVKASEEILAGTVNLSGVIKVKVSNEFGQSTVARILDLVENASSKKAPTEKFITKFSKYYTPIVVISAVLLAVIPPIIIQDANFSEWLYRALIFLVVSCPCALVVSIPLALFAGIGGASKKGILVKGGNYLEALKDVNAVVFDKTGTLTKGVFKVTKINGVNIENDKLLEIAALGESFSNHPIANSITNQYNKPIDKALVSDYKEISGNGISAAVERRRVLLGNSKLMIENNIKYSSDEEIGTIIHIAIDNEYKGYIVISDEVKEDSKHAIEGLKKIGIKRIVMLTGDNRIIANKIGKELGIDEVYSELLPVDKVDKIEEIINNKSIKGKVAFVGDGVNDAPVLARADIGMAMGGIGSDAAIEAADVVLMKDTPSSIIDAINSGRRITKILWQNIIFSLGVKSAVLILGAIGLANMWEGVFADVGVTIIAVINSMRALKK